MPDTAKAFGGVQCSAVRPQTEPDLTGWDAGSRAKLRSLSKQGVVAVHYEANGCDVRLEVLANCVGKGAYSYQPYAAQDTKVARSTQELFTQVPLGAASLQGKLSGGKVLRTDYILVGMGTLPANKAYVRSDLEGPECERATHIVNVVYVGGFGMAAGESRSIEGTATVFGLGGGAKDGGAVERVTSDGDASACDEAKKNKKEDDNCAVPLRIGLQKLSDIVPTQAVASSPSPMEGMVSIPGATFLMGEARRQVPVGAFLMDRTEVTVGAYRACVKAGKCTPAGGADVSPYCNWPQSGKETHPINCVDWNQAKAYCEWLGKRLPTEEEWEYAARGTDGRTHPWGNSEPAGQLCWKRWENKAGTCVVGSYGAGASPFGLMDMAGNVWELTATAFDATHRVIRGGGWFTEDPTHVRAAHRLTNTPAYRDVGFRCAR